MRNKPRLLRGELVSLDAWKREILAIIIRYGEPGASATQIAHHLGEPYRSQKPQEEMMPQLQRMVDRGVIRRAGCGLFCPGNLDQGVSSTDQHERLVLDVLRRHGGMAFYREIIWALGQTDPIPQRHRRRRRRTRPENQDRWEQASGIDLDYRKTGTATAVQEALGRLVRDGRVRRDYNVAVKVLSEGFAGLYNLPPEAWPDYPLWGRNVRIEFLTRQPLELGGIPRAAVEVSAAIDGVLASAAATARLARLRAEMTVEEVLSAPGVAWTLGVWKRDCRIDLERLRQSRGLRGAGVARTGELEAELFRRFESFRSRDEGFCSRLPNLWLEPEFWLELGKLYGVDGSALSRGRLVPVGEQPPPIEVTGFPEGWEDAMDLFERDEDGEEEEEGAPDEAS